MEVAQTTVVQESRGFYQEAKNTMNTYERTFKQEAEIIKENNLKGDGIAERFARAIIAKGMDLRDNQKL